MNKKALFTQLLCFFSFIFALTYWYTSQPSEAERIKELEKKLQHKDAFYRQQALFTLEEIGSPAIIPLIIKELKDPEPSLQKYAYNILKRCSFTKSLPYLIAVLESPENQTHLQIIRIIGEHRQLSIEAIPVLLRICDQSTSEKIRVQGIWALSEIAPQSEKTITLFKKSLKDSSANVRKAAIRALSKLDPESAQELIPSLMLALKDKSPIVRIQTAKFLGKIASPMTVPVLIPALKDYEKVVQEQACNALAKIGKKDPEIIPLLEKAFQDPDPMVRYWILKAFYEMGSQANTAIPLLITALKDSDYLVRMYSAMTLGKLGPTAKEAVPALIYALYDANKRVSYEVIETLGIIGKEASPAIPNLLKLLEHSNPKFQKRISQTLIQMDPQKLVPALILTLKNTKVEVRTQSVWMLGEMGIFAREALYDLREALKDEDYLVRKAAAIALGKLKAKETLPDLRQALKDVDLEVSKAAISALLQIGTTEALEILHNEQENPKLHSIIKKIFIQLEKKEKTHSLD